MISFVMRPAGCSRQNSLDISFRNGRLFIRKLTTPTTINLYQVHCAGGLSFFNQGTESADGLVRRTVRLRSVSPQTPAERRISHSHLLSNNLHAIDQDHDHATT